MDWDLHYGGLGNKTMEVYIERTFDSLISLIKNHGISKDDKQK